MMHAQDHFDSTKNFGPQTQFFVFFKQTGKRWKLVQDQIIDETEARAFAEPMRDEGQIRITKRVTTVLGGT